MAPHRNSKTSCEADDVVAAKDPKRPGQAIFSINHVMKGQPPVKL